MEDRADEAAAQGRSDVQSVGERPHHGQSSPSESTRLLNSIAGHLAGFVYRCRDDAQWTVEYISGGFQALTGYAPEDLVGNRLFGYSELIHPEDRPLVVAVSNCDKLEGARIAVEYRLCRRDGAVRWVCERAVRVYDQPSASWKWEGFIEDITERKRAEHALHEANERYQSIF